MLVCAMRKEPREIPVEPLAFSAKQRQLLIFSRAVAAMVIAIATLGILGWLFSIETLKSILPELATMKLNTALAFAVSGVSLMLIASAAGPAAGGRQAARYQRHIQISQWGGALVALMGALTLGEYLFDWSLGIDQWLIEDSGGGSSAIFPGRMSPSTAACFLATGLALMSVDTQWSGGLRPAPWLCLAVGFVGAVAVLGYAYGIGSLYDVWAYSSMALHTAVTFVLLAAGIVCARPLHSGMRRITSDDSAMVLIGRLLPAAVLVPAVTGWLGLQGQLMDLYDSTFRLALFVTLNIIIFSALIWSAAAELQRTDAERRRAEQNVAAQVHRLDLLRQITQAVNESRDQGGIFQIAIQRVEADLSVDFACICLYDPVTERFTASNVGARGAALVGKAVLAQHQRISARGESLARCLKGEVVYEPDTAHCPPSFAQRLAGSGLQSLVASPLFAEGKVFALLIVARLAADAFSTNDREFLQQLSAHVALAAHQAQLHDALQAAYDDLRQSQQALSQHERLRALGQMASGITHDINNAISPVLIYTEIILKTEQSLSTQAREFLKLTQNAVDSVAQTVGRLREFYRTREEQPTLIEVDLNRIARSVIALTQARWGTAAQANGIDIRMMTRLATDLPPILAAESEIRDALTNLIFNAIDAMPNGGTLEVSTGTGNVALSKRDRLVGWAWIEVRDTGLGMDDQTLQRCMEPFFTTKGERGTGLGLAMVFGMAQRHGAEFEIDSAVTEGTSVRLSFPVYAFGRRHLDTVPSRQEARDTQQPLRILLVDDDPLVVDSLSKALRAEGHTVVAADGGQSGIDMFMTAQSRCQPFEVVITDLGMPQVDGRKVAAAIKAASGQTPIILLTGWSWRASDESVTPHVDKVLAKPAKLGELRATLLQLTAAVAATELQ